MSFTIIGVALVILLGSFVQGLTGFGLALVSVPLLSLFLDIQTAVPLAGIFAWAINVPLVFKMRAHVNWQVAALMAAASIPGSFLGAALLKVVPGVYLLIVMGIVLVLASWHALRKKKAADTVKTSALASCLAGAASGVLGASVGEPGPPTIAYLSMQPWDADRIKATLLCFFMLQMMGALVSFWQKGLLTERIFSLFGFGLASFVVGLLLGIKAWDLLKRSKINYQHAVHCFLLGIGLFLIVKNVFLLLP